MSSQESQEVDFEEKCEDIETITLPPDSTPHMTDIEKWEEEIKKEDADLQSTHSLTIV